MHVKGTVVVMIRAVSTSAKATRASRIRIPIEQYEAEVAAAKKEERPSKYFLEKDQDCEGLSLPDAVKARAAQKAEEREAVTVGPANVGNVADVLG